MKGKYYFLAVFFLMAAAFAVFTFLRYGAKSGTPEQLPVVTLPHAYKNLERGIARIKIKAFYAVPKNKIGQVDQNWNDEIKMALDKAVAFHRLQFRGLSGINYDIFSQPIFLTHDDIVYDTISTNGGNQRGLVSIAQEIESRVFQKNGDLYDEKFASQNNAEYRVMAIAYEGVGASGGIIYESPLTNAEDIARKLGVATSSIYIVDITSVDAFFLVNRKEYLANTFLETGSSIFYHEFAHTLGIPDEYDKENRPSSNDIMGAGREKPIENTYLSGEVLKEMGVN